MTLKARERGLFDMQWRGSQLVVRRRGAPYRRSYFWAAGMTAIVLVLLVGYLAAARVNHWVWLLTGLVMLVLLALAERGLSLRSAIRDDEYCLDRDGDAFLHNGEVVAPFGTIDHILVRQVVDGTKPREEYALVVSLKDTRRLTIAETLGVEGEKEDIERAARSIAEFVGVNVERETRQASEWWLDR